MKSPNRMVIQLERDAYLLSCYGNLIAVSTLEGS